MKKLVLSIVALAVVALTGNNAIARNVTEAEAAQAAACYMEYNTMHEGVVASDLRLAHRIDGEVAVAAYCFNVSDWGWVIISGSTVVDPIMAYSDEGNLGEWETLAPAMRWWVEMCAGEISKVQVADIEGKFADHQEWSELFSGKMSSNAKDGDPRVILLSSKWDQGDERHPTYNLFCPYDSTTNRYSITGCVATAMAQIVRYYGYPIVPKGRKNYYTDPPLSFNLRLKFDTLRFDYSLMPDRLLNSSPRPQIENVAWLNYACGVSVEMDYSPDGSGTQSSQVDDAMKNHFKYQMGTYLERRYTTTDNFISTIRNDLMLRRPVYMSGASSSGSGADAAGHAWVCCGYRTDNNKMYYMNWGWAGGGDAFFNIYDNTANAMYISGYGYTFNLSQAVITGMIPPHPDSSAVDFMTPIRLVEDNTVLAPAYPNPAAFSVTLPYSISSAAEMQILSVDGRLVATRRLLPGNGQVTLDVSGMPAGIYVYRVGGQSGKFVVN